MNSFTHQRNKWLQADFIHLQSLQSAAAVWGCHHFYPGSLSSLIPSPRPKFQPADEAGLPVPLCACGEDKSLNVRSVSVKWRQIGDKGLVNKEQQLWVKNTNSSLSSPLFLTFSHGLAVFTLNLIFVWISLFKSPWSYIALHIFGLVLLWWSRQWTNNPIKSAATFYTTTRCRGYECEVLIDVKKYKNVLFLGKCIAYVPSAD